MTRCVRHVLGEMARTSFAIDALNRRDVPALGKLLQASHASLRDDYRVSCPELDFLADTFNALSGVAGARMIGGGFGGSVLAVVHQSSIPEIETEIGRAYRCRFERSPTLFTTRPAAGTRAWQVG